MTTIILAADEKYLPYVPCNLAQFARFARRAEGVTLLVPPTVGADHLEGATAAAFALDLALEVVPLAELSTLHSREVIADRGYVSYFTYSKLLFAEALQHLDDVLYLDVDTLIRAPIDDLLSWELRHPVGAVQELINGGTRLFGTARQPYFNAGVLRMSLARLRQERAWDHALEILAQRPGLRLQDQDVLNLLFSNRFDSLPFTFNVLDSVRPHAQDLDVFLDPVIVHFTGPQKPWHLSAESEFALEWQIQNRQVAEFSGPPLPSPTEPSVQSNNPRGRLYGFAKRALPDRLRTNTKAATIAALDRAVERLEEARSALSQPVAPAWFAALHTWSSIAGNSSDEERTSDEDHGLDLLVSVARSGTNALGDVIRRSRPGVNYLDEIYMGSVAGLGESAVVDRFPWFAAGHPDIRKQAPWLEKHRMERDFAAKMSEHVVEFTATVLERGQGRTLIKVLPDHLHTAAVAKLLRAFRPRLLILRRDMVFTYISERRAALSRLRGGTDSTNAPYEVSDRTAFEYGHKCDRWFNLVARMAQDLDLEQHWVTYDGIFATGSDISVIQSFYPGPDLPINAATGALISEFAVQDRRTDTSVLEMIKGVAGLSVTAQAQLLRLPGNHLEAAQVRPAYVRKRS